MWMSGDWCVPSLSPIIYSAIFLTYGRNTRSFAIRHMLASLYGDHMTRPGPLQLRDIHQICVASDRMTGEHKAQSICIYYYPSLPLDVHTSASEMHATMVTNNCACPFHQLKPIFLPLDISPFPWPPDESWTVKNAANECPAAHSSSPPLLLPLRTEKYSTQKVNYAI